MSTGDFTDAIAIADLVTSNSRIGTTEKPQAAYARLPEYAFVRDAGLHDGLRIDPDRDDDQAPGS